MTFLAAFCIALLLLFGLLALPYSAALAVICWLLSAGIIGVLFLRQRARLPRTLAAVLVFCVLGVLIWNVVLMPWANTEVISAVTTRNADGTSGSALLVYHPGRSDLQERAITGFVDGLVAAGWRVDLTTASAQTPTDLSSYDLLVLGAQSYTWAPARPVQDYLRRVADLAGKSVVVILSGLGETGPANGVMRDLVAETNGALIEIYNIWQLRPIDDLYGVNDPQIAMYNAATALMLP
jgi:hypothetical protein